MDVQYAVLYGVLAEKAFVQGYPPPVETWLACSPVAWAHARVGSNWPFCESAVVIRVAEVISVVFLAVIAYDCLSHIKNRLKQNRPGLFGTGRTQHAVSTGPCTINLRRIFRQKHAKGTDAKLIFVEWCSTKYRSTLRWTDTTYESVWTRKGATTQGAAAATSPEWSLRPSDGSNIPRNARSVCRMQIGTRRHQLMFGSGDSLAWAPLPVRTRLELEPVCIGRLPRICTFPPSRNVPPAGIRCVKRDYVAYPRTSVGCRDTITVRHLRPDIPASVCAVAACLDLACLRQVYKYKDLPSVCVGDAVRSRKDVCR